jgi:hypothetical protein
VQPHTQSLMAAALDAQRWSVGDFCGSRRKHVMRPARTADAADAYCGLRVHFGCAGRHKKAHSKATIVALCKFSLANREGGLLVVGAASLALFTPSCCVFVVGLSALPLPCLPAETGVRRLTQGVHMSFAHCVPLPSSNPRRKWAIVVVLVVIAAASPHVAELLALAAGAVTLVGASLIEGSTRQDLGGRLDGGTAAICMSTHGYERRPAAATYAVSVVVSFVLRSVPVRRRS